MHLPTSRKVALFKSVSRTLHQINAVPTEIRTSTLQDKLRKLGEQYHNRNTQHVKNINRIGRPMSTSKKVNCNAVRTMIMMLPICRCSKQTDACSRHMNKVYKTEMELNQEPLYTGDRTGMQVAHRASSNNSLQTKQTEITETCFAKS